MVTAATGRCLIGWSGKVGANDWAVERFEEWDIEAVNRPRELSLDLLGVLEDRTAYGGSPTPLWAQRTRGRKPSRGLQATVGRSRSGSTTAGFGTVDPQIGKGALAAPTLTPKDRIAGAESRRGERDRVHRDAQSTSQGGVP